MLDTVTPTKPSPPAPAPPVERRKPRRELLPYALLVPAVLLELLIHIIPMVVGVGISFLNPDAPPR